MTLATLASRCWRETDVETTDLETVITDLLDGQYNNPVRVVGFNWQRAGRVCIGRDRHELRRRCDLQMTDVPINPRRLP